MRQFFSPIESAFTFNSTIQCIVSPQIVINVVCFLFRRDCWALGHSASHVFCCSTPAICSYNVCEVPTECTALVPESLRRSRNQWYVCVPFPLDSEYLTFGEVIEIREE